MLGSSHSSRVSLFAAFAFCLAALMLGGASVAWAGDNNQGIDWTLMGMGLFGGLALFLSGMDMMSDALKALSGERMKDILAKLTASRLMGALTGAFVTAVIQSSSATTGIVILMASQGFISLPTGIALAFGANIGTCVTALLASIGKPREAVRAALVHVLFNLGGVLLWLGLIDQPAVFVQWSSPAHPDLSGAQRLAAEAPRQIANAHTIFYLANTLIFIWFTGQFARLVEWMVPDRPLDEEAAMIRPKYLDEELLSTP